MNQTIMTFISLVFLTCSDNNTDLESIKIHFAKVDEAKALLTSEDDFTSAWSQFDIDSRIGKSASSRAELLSHISDQVLEWNPSEKEKITASASRINAAIEKGGFNLNLKQDVTLVKTTGKEEGGAAGYTRGNYIVLGTAISGMDDNNLDRLMAHELFHVISRNNPELRTKLYGLIGFSMMSPIAYPDVLRPYRITNPDATQTDCYLNINVGEDSFSAMMILYANKPYEGGSFFNYLNIGFLRLDENYLPVITEEGPEIYSMKEVENFYEQVGNNTQYIIHPEEIMADNFSYALLGKADLKNPELVEKIRKALKQD